MYNKWMNVFLNFPMKSGGIYLDKKTNIVYIIHMYVRIYVYFIYWAKNYKILF